MTKNVEVIIYCDLDKIGHERTKNAYVRDYKKLMGNNLTDSVIIFWSRDIWEQLEKTN